MSVQCLPRTGAAERPALGASGSAALLAVACLTIMVGCVIVPGLPSIAPALGVADAASWLVTVPSLGVVVFGSVAGRLIDWVGARKALCIGLVGYGVLGPAAVLLRGPVPVFTDRLLLGGATALVMASGTTLISEFFRGERRLAMIARQGMAIELGGVIFLSIGGCLTGVGWAAPFALYGVAFLFLLMVTAFVPGTPGLPVGTDSALDGRDRAAIRPVLAAALCSMIVFFAAVINLPFTLSDPRAAGLSEAGTGYFLSFVSLVAVGFAGIMPKAAARIGQRRTLVTAFLCYTCAQTIFALASTLPVCVIGGILLGAGFGLSIPLVNHMTIERSPAPLRGRNLAHLSMAIFLGQFLASPLQYVPGGHLASFAGAAAIALAAAILGLTRFAR